jgi:ribosomal protein S18 acetylase RimI-like enzyme
MERWRIRAANADDAVGLTDCIETAYAADAARLPDLPAVSEGIASDIKNHLVFVAGDGHTIAGGIILIPQTGFLHLANIAVRPNFTGQGLGRALLDLAEAQARRLKLPQMRLSTHAGMANTISLYRHLGWHEFSREGSKVQMRKTISPQAASSA